MADARYPTGPQRLAFFDQVLERIRALPNVQATAATSEILGRGAANVGIKGRPKTEDEPDLYAGFICVTPDYFKTLGIPLLKGRWFSAEDRQGAPKVVMINETMARRVWPGQDPIGKQVTPGDSTGQGPGTTVIGVVKDVRYLGPQAGPEPDMFLPCEQWPFLSAVVVRTTGDPLRLASLIRSQIALVDKNQPVQRIYTIEQELDQEFARPRFYRQLLGVFAALAFALAVVGIYGVMAYTVARNRREFGVRMALGAQKRNVLSLVIGQGMKLALAGVGLGVLAALALTRLMRGLLYGVEPFDPLTFVGVSVLFFAIAIFACWLPARRAAEVDPMAALRYE
ncbi:MAG: ABC transporter permease [Chloroflexi bacterium]|nr:ABC transporter permease [Chloroflexota bacterium]